MKERDGERACRHATQPGFDVRRANRRVVQSDQKDVSDPTALIYKQRDAQLAVEASLVEERPSDFPIAANNEYAEWRMQLSEELCGVCIGSGVLCRTARWKITT